MQDKPLDLSRRSFFRKMLACVIGTAALSGGVANLARAGGVMPKSQVAYQDTPKDGQRCDQCTLFISPGGCQMVKGSISPQGWCRLFMQKKA